ncbi:MAG TPA: ATP-dependent helicase HrpB [Myxococcaceae bacterium]|nr:ATP-dependent helicase HrpB [Myxococcaceae bacterium]
MTARAGPSALPPLPVDALLPSLVQALRTGPAAVLQAAPGAGKTTRVPPALLDAGIAGDGEVLVLEPRRLATRLAAGRVAEERGEPVGETVGYQVRFEERTGPRTRIRFLTEGILGRRLLSDPTLAGVGVVVLDEFHERQLPGDIALALLRRLQAEGSPLRLVVMSATLDARPLAGFLGGCPVLTSEGRAFPVDVEHLAAADRRPLEEQVLGALKRLLSSLPEGDVLAFLPGASEIRRAQEACAAFAERHGLTVTPLHGDLSIADQERAVRSGPGRKLILSTNVAETSITVPGVAAVIDSGLARISVHSPWSGLPSLQILPISQASAIQRAGRAGRTRAGRALRLYTRADFETRPPHTTPEIARSDLSEAVLALAAAGVVDRRRFAFFEAPAPPALEAAERLLADLGALGPDGALTPLGRRMLAFPIHPRLARVVVEGERRGVASQAASAVALLGERDLRRSARTALGAERSPGAPVSARSDVLERLADLASAEHGRRRDLDAATLAAVQRAARQLRRLVDAGRPPPATDAAREDALLVSLLAGFPDRVARRRVAHRADLILSEGGSATLDEASAVREPLLLVALDAEVRSGPRGPKTRVRVASEVEAEWLLDLFPERLRDEDALEWNPEQSRVDRVSRLRYRELVLEETRSPAPPSEAAFRLVAEELRRGALERLVDAELLASWQARLGHLARSYPESGVKPPGPELREAVIAALAEGRSSLAELDPASVQAVLEAHLPVPVRELLARALPARILLPGGRSLAVHYPPGAPPFVASRLQDFFGLRQGPRVCDGKLPLVLQLLAPNQRPVQVTTDLAGFWTRHYPGLRRELARRYPRHAWPEDPLNASPPKRTGHRAPR